MFGFLSFGEAVSFSVLGIIALVLGLLLACFMGRKGALVILAIELVLCGAFALDGINFFKCILVCVGATAIAYVIRGLLWFVGLFR